MMIRHTLALVDRMNAFVQSSADGEDVAKVRALTEHVQAFRLGRF